MDLPPRPGDARMADGPPDPPLCDAHVHVVGDPARYPQVAARSYTAGLATLDALQGQAAPAGVGRFVIVQPSFYGTDNTLLLESLDALGGRGRGVAVIDPARTGAAALQALHARGVRGLRINLYSPLGGAGRTLGEAFAAMAAAAATQGWHVQVIAPVAVLAEAARGLAASPVPVVIDHYGLPAGAAPEGAAGRALLRLLARGHVWMKLSAPYRSSGDALAVRPDAAWLRAILEAGAERCVWGSDWPHTPPHALQGGAEVPLAYRRLDYRAVLEGFTAALPSGASAWAILRDNPARLYDFPGRGGL